MTMTEMEELKQAAEMQKHRQNFEELRAYIETLHADIKALEYKDRRNDHLEHMAFATWLITTIANGVWDTGLTGVALLLVIFVLGRKWIFITTHLEFLRGELHGCFRTLEILGFISPYGGRRRKTKYKESIIARVWAAVKRKKRSEAFA